MLAPLSISIPGTAGITPTAGATFLRPHVLKAAQLLNRRTRTIASNAHRAPAATINLL
jgi:hypothetical protein